MNKFVLLLAPVLSAGILFTVSRSSFMDSGLPDGRPEKVETYGLPEKGEKLLNREIVDPIRAKKGKATRADMYSRCPSGVTYYLTATPENEGGDYYVGEVADRVGCRHNLVCVFRMDKSMEVLEAKSTEEETEYLPVAEWKKAARAEWSF